MRNLRRRRRGLVYTLSVALCFILVFIFSTLPTSAAPADTGFNITTSPLPVELNTIPGKTVSTSLRVEDSGTAPVKIKVSLLKFKAAGHDGKPLLLKRQPGDSFFDWVNFSQNSFVAQPGVWNNIQMTINPPKEAAFGYYYAVVFSQDTSGQLPASPNTGKLNGATATLVLLNVQAPGEKKQLEVTSFTASKKLYEYLPATFNIRVHNPGNIHLLPSGTIFISRDHKNNIATLDVNASKGSVLPASNRIFQTTWDSGFPVYVIKRDHDQIISDKHGQPIQQLKWNFATANKMRFGHYYAHLLLTYDNGTQDIPIDAEVGFWVVPWKILPIMLLTLLLILIGLWSSGRSFVKWVRKKQPKK